MIGTRNIRTAHKWYNETYELKNSVSIATYREIVDGFICKIIDKLLEGNFVQLSGGDSMGSIGVAGSKVKAWVDKDGKIRGAAPDWGATKKLWAENPEAKEQKKVIYCLNEHSDGIKYNLVWWTADAKLPNKSFYSFVFRRPLKRSFSALVKSGREYYIKVEKVKNYEQVNGS